MGERAVKPHLPFDKQLDKLVGRGMTFSDRPRALAALKGIGYYRLSAYAYPLRQPPTDEDLAAGRKRNDKFVEGATVEDVLRLYEFDEKLRAALLRALQTVEVGLAVKVGYTLGKRAPDAHTLRRHLDTERCDDTNHTGRSGFDRWMDRYEKLRHDAREEDYVKHHLMHYDGDIPVWAATGFLDFGAVVRLLGLMKKEDRRSIAASFELGGDGSETLHRWMKALTILRNNCAHNNRVWNRSSVDVPPKIPTPVVPAGLKHLNDLANDERQKIYLLAALTAHLVVVVDPRSRWPWETFKTIAKKFGNVQGMTLENTLGFPVGWAELDIWNAPR